jgi:methionyl-tRNA formyltransferase
MRLLFFGSGSFGLPTLRFLNAEHDVRAVISQPDRPAGRRRRPTPTPIAAYAAEAELPLLQYENINTDEATARLRSFDVDAWVVIAFGQKLSPSLLADRFAINLHASLLPRWRGAAPIHHAVLAGDAQTGLSVITLAERMDAGDVLASAAMTIAATDTTGLLHERLAERGPSIVEAVLRMHAGGDLAPQHQDESLATAAPKLTRAEAVIDASMGPDVLRATINGCSPWPGVTARIGDQHLRLLQAGPATSPQAMGVIGEDGLLGCVGGAVTIVQVQPQGGRPMPYEAWARGRRMQWPAAVQFGAEP